MTIEEKLALALKISKTKFLNISESFFSVTRLEENEETAKFNNHNDGMFIGDEVIEWKSGYRISFTETETINSKKKIKQLLSNWISGNADYDLYPKDILIKDNSLVVVDKAAEQFKKLLEQLDAESLNDAKIKLKLEEFFELKDQLDSSRHDKKNDIYTLKLHYQKVEIKDLPTIVKRIKNTLRNLVEEKQRSGFGAVEIFSQTLREINISGRAAKMLTEKITEWRLEKIDREVPKKEDKKDEMRPLLNPNTFYYTKETNKKKEDKKCCWFFGL